MIYIKEIPIPMTKHKLIRDLEEELESENQTIQHYRDLLFALTFAPPCTISHPHSGEEMPWIDGAIATLNSALGALEEAYYRKGLLEYAIADKENLEGGEPYVF